MLYVLAGVSQSSFIWGGGPGGGEEGGGGTSTVVDPGN